MNRLITVLSVLTLTLGFGAIITDSVAAGFIGIIVACVGLMLVAGRADAAEESNADRS